MPGACHLQRHTDCQLLTLHTTPAAAHHIRMISTHFACLSEQQRWRQTTQMRKQYSLIECRAISMLQTGRHGWAD